MSILPAAPFTLIRLDGATVVFDDMISLQRTLRAWNIHVGAFHIAVSTYQPHPSNPQTTRNDYIVRDLYGRRVTQAQIDAYIDPASSPARNARSRLYQHQTKQTLHAATLGLSIPGTGKCRRRHSKLHRHPRHLNVYQAAAAVRHQQDDDKAKGKIPLPPNAYDDILRADYGHRSWKKSRKTQYRPKTIYPDNHTEQYQADDTR